MRIREEVGRRTAVIKSNNPHLRGGEQCLLFELIVELVHNVCKTKGDTRKSVVNFRKWAQTCKSDRSPSKAITLSKHHMSTQTEPKREMNAHECSYLCSYFARAGHTHTHTHTPPKARKKP